MSRTAFEHGSSRKAGLGGNRFSLRFLKPFWLIKRLVSFMVYFALRIQVCPKKGITSTLLFFSDGIGTLTIRSGGVWILRVGNGTFFFQIHYQRFNHGL